MADASLDEKIGKLRIDKSLKRPRRFRFRWSWLVVLVVLGGAGYGMYTRAMAPLSVRTTPVEQEAVMAGRGPALVTATGYVVPRHKVEVSSKIIGRVVELNVKRGDKVNAGDVLLRIEDADYQARVAQAKAGVAAAEARLRELQAGSRVEEIASAKASAAASAAELVNARVEHERLAQLVAAGVSSPQELDRAKSARDVAQARLAADRSNADLVEKGPRQEVIDAAQAQLAQAQADVKLAETELENTVIRAPIGGTVLEKIAEVGELVTNSNFGGTRGAKSSVLTMADLGDLQVEVDVNQAELSKVRVGQNAEVRLDIEPDKAYRGRVDEISPQADRQKGTVQAKVAILDAGEAFKTEVNARVTFLGEVDPARPGSEKPRLWIPRSAVVQSGKTAQVYVMEGGAAVAKEVRTGIEGEKGIEVLEGLAGSEVIIVGPMDQVKPGVRVQAAQ